LRNFAVPLCFVARHPGGRLQADDLCFFATTGADFGFDSKSNGTVSMPSALWSHS
jgi:hypothetical protein